MAYDYALVHLKFTIPLAGLLTLVLRPLLTRLDLYKTLALIVIAVTATIPWDSYLIHHGIWTYPPDAIVGPKLFSIPAEELFFFVIQTYVTSMVYIILNKPVLHSQYLTSRNDSPGVIRRRWTFVQFLFGVGMALGAYLVKNGGEGTYLGLILVWACPFALLTWTFSGPFITQLPPGCVITPIILPTIYLWIVDELALGRGTWSIESGTKLGWCLWGHLEIEEAVFFLATNILIVFGLVAFDCGLTVLDTFPELFPEVSNTPSIGLLMKGVLSGPPRYNTSRVCGIREAVARLQLKSRSFYLASSVFPGRLRIDLILLYSFCRMADDLIDDSQTHREAAEWIEKLTGYLDVVYSEKAAILPTDSKLRKYIRANFPRSTHSALELLPTSLLASQPLYGLLEGFKMDAAFTRGTGSNTAAGCPVKTERDLEVYASHVASTVGELCLQLVFHHSKTRIPSENAEALVQAARIMGHALQYVNISRDIAVDARMGRVYIPATWLEEEDLTPGDIIEDPTLPAVEKLRGRLLDAAFKEYKRSRPAMDMLPRDVRGPLIVAVESYMEIGRVLRQRKGVPSSSRPGRATVPRARRLWVAWKVLSAQ